MKLSTLVDMTYLLPLLDAHTPTTFHLLHPSRQNMRDPDA